MPPATWTFVTFISSLPICNGWSAWVDGNRWKWIVHYMLSCLQRRMDFSDKGQMRAAHCGSQHQPLRCAVAHVISFWWGPPPPCTSSSTADVWAQGCVTPSSRILQNQNRYLHGARDSVSILRKTTWTPDLSATTSASSAISFNAESSFLEHWVEGANSPPASILSPSSHFCSQERLRAICQIRSGDVDGWDALQRTSHRLYSSREVRKTTRPKPQRQLWEIYPSNRLIDPGHNQIADCTLKKTRQS